MTIAAGDTVKWIEATQVYELIRAAIGISRMLVADTPPPVAIAGQQWWDSDAGKMYVRYEDPSAGHLRGFKCRVGAVAVATSCRSATLRRSRPRKGELWFNSTDASLYVWFDDGTGAQWVDVSGVGGGGGAPLIETDPLALHLTGGTLTGGLSFGSANAAAANNLTRHIALYGTEIGFSVTGGNKLNYRVADSNDTHAFGYDTTDALTITGAAITAKVAATFSSATTFTGADDVQRRRRRFTTARFENNSPIKWLTSQNADYYTSATLWTVLSVKTKDDLLLCDIQVISGGGPPSGSNVSGAFKVDVGNKTSGKLTAFETVRDTNPVDFSVQGDVLARGVQLTSDASLKHDIRDFDRAQTDAIFATLKPKRYRWSDVKIEQEDGETVTVPCSDQREQYGFIADDMHTSIVQGEEGEKSYDLAAIVAVLVAKVKAQDDELKALKAKVH